MAHKDYPVFGIPLIVFVFSTLACMPAMKMIYGIHQPRHVTDENVIKLSRKLNLQGDIYRLSKYNEASHSKFRYLGNSMPDLLIFNTNGELTKYTVNCSGRLDSIVNLSRHDIDSMSVTSKSIQDFISDSYKIPSNSTLDLTQITKPVYALKFAEFAGKLNTENVPGWIEILKQRDDVCYILLNMDYTLHK